MSTKIALDGVGGQGVRVIAGVMGSLLAAMGKESSSTTTRASAAA
jgi:Pyruvate/2-oxoacid:ferredoxin oxidoreductase gamma subunit